MEVLGEQPMHLGPTPPTLTYIFAHRSSIPRVRVVIGTPDCRALAQGREEGIERVVVHGQLPSTQHRPTMGSRTPQDIDWDR